MSGELAQLHFGIIKMATAKKTSATTETRGGLTAQELSDYEIYQKARAKNEVLKAQLGEIELGKQRVECNRLVPPLSNPHKSTILSKKVCWDSR